MLNFDERQSIPGFSGIKRPVSGFSMVELLISLVIVGIVIIPIYNIFSTGQKSTIQNTDYFIAHNLARDRLEEMKILPFGRIKGDFDVFSKIYRDSGIEIFADMDVDEVVFHSGFSDIFTEDMVRKHPELFGKFSSAFREHFGREYILYPKKYAAYARTTMVEPYGSSTTSGHSLKKVLVRVSLTEKKQVIAEVATLMEGR